MLVAVGVDVGVGEVTGVDANEVTGGAQVRLQVGHERTIEAHREGERDLATVVRHGVDRDLVAIDRRGCRRTGQHLG